MSVASDTRKTVPDRLASVTEGKDDTAATPFTGTLTQNDVDGNDEVQKLGLYIWKTGQTRSDAEAIRVQNVTTVNTDADGVEFAGTYGTITFTWDSTENRWNFSYQLNDDQENINSLNAGEEGLSEVFHLVTRDLAGRNSDSVTLTIPIIGANDTPVIVSHQATGTVDEDGGTNNLTSGANKTASGYIIPNDVDDEDTAATLGLKIAVKKGAEADFDAATDDDQTFGHNAAAEAQTGAGEKHATKVIAGSYGYFVLTWVDDVDASTTGNQPGWGWVYHLADGLTADSLPADLAGVEADDLTAMKTALGGLAANVTKTE